MARRAGRPCGVPGCPGLVHDPSKRLCPEHDREHMRRQSQERRAAGTHADYGPRWLAISARYLRMHPTCAHCGRPSELVHHVVERADGGSDADENLLALCRPCHSRLHAKGRGGWGA